MHLSVLKIYKVFYESLRYVILEYDSSLPLFLLKCYVVT